MGIMVRLVYFLPCRFSARLQVFSVSKPLPPSIHSSYDCPPLPRRECAKGYSLNSVVLITDFPFALFLGVPFFVLQVGHRSISFSVKGDGARCVVTAPPAVLTSPFRASGILLTLYSPLSRRRTCECPSRISRGKLDSPSFRLFRLFAACVR